MKTSGSRKPSDYFHDNFSVTTSGFNWEPALRFCIDVLGIEKIMYAVDYPKDTVFMVDRIEKVNLSDAERDAIYFQNAERIFGIKPAAGLRVMKSWQRARPRIAALEPLFQPGRREHQLHPALDVQPSDMVVDKSRYSALTHDSSDLNRILEDAGIESVIVTGVATNCCCESTARDADMLGYKTYVVSDACATFADEEHNAALLNLAAIFADVRTADDMIALIRRARVRS